MKVDSKKTISLFLSALLFSQSVSAKTKATTKELSDSSADTPQWYIYQKSIKNVYKGPFKTLEDVIQAWDVDPALQPKSKFFIGKNKRLITDNPNVYFGLEEPEEEVLVSEPEETEPVDTAVASTTPKFPTALNTSQKIDRVKKVYLSDFMDMPSYTLPSDDMNSFDAGIIEDLYDIDPFGRTTLMNTVKAGNDWKVRALLNAGADVNAKDNDGWTALMYAARYQNSLPMLELLLQYNPDVKMLNNYGLSALILASCYNENPDVVKKLLSFYSPTEKEVQKAFIMLISTQAISEYTLVAKMSVFIETGLPLNSYYDGKTPLMYVCKFGSSTNVVKLLIDNNATIELRSTDGKTAFEYASENKNLRHDDIYWSLNTR